MLARWDMKLTVSSAWGTLHCFWYAALLYDKFQVLCVLFNEVWCVKGLCLQLFYHAKEELESS
jgi:hypothetical protein